MDPVRRIEPAPWMMAPDTSRVMAALGARGATARFVGGCVRDTLLGRPFDEVDIATDARPEEVIALLGDAGIKAVPTGIQHGTITAVTDGNHFEITTLRQDVRTHGRHADVAYTDDWAADAARRDFTVNALFLDTDGTLFDPCGGLADLERGRMRFVGDAETRIREDVLRLLRYFRFYALYDRPPPDEDALAAARNLAPLLGGLSGERIWQELARLLTAPEPGAVFALMGEVGVLREILPEAQHLGRLAALAEVAALGGIAVGEDNALLMLAALVETDGAGAEAVAARLRLSRAQRIRLKNLAQSQADLAPDTPALDARRLYYRFGREAYRDLVYVSWAATRAAADAAEHLEIDRDYRALLEISDAPPPVLPVRGEDAVALGLPPGPAVGRAIAEVESWWVEEAFAPDRAACLARLKAAIAGPKP
jgi:poly(A) polymerase